MLIIITVYFLTDEKGLIGVLPLCYVSVCINLPRYNLSFKDRSNKAEQAPHL